MTRPYNAASANIPILSWLGKRIWRSGLASSTPSASIGTHPDRQTSPRVVLVPSTNRSASPNDIFTPTRPRSGGRNLIGRETELKRVLEALNDEAAHVVIYAERGRGKTSLANTAVERLRQAGVMVGRHVCGAESDFDQIIHGVMRDLPSSLLPQDFDAVAQPTGRGCDYVLAGSGLQPADVADIPRQLACGRLVFVVDEFDRVQDQATRTRLADTIKLLSDRGSKLLFMIIGVSSTLEQIIGQHPSIQRNIAGIHLPLLHDSEVRSMLFRGGEAVGIIFSPAASAVVAGVARGMPYIAQLMGLRITQQTLARGGKETSAQDLASAVDRLLADQSSEVVTRYAALTSGSRGTAMEAALHRASGATQDWLGRINLAMMEPGLVAALIDEKVVEPAASLPGTLQVADRPLMTFVLLLAVRNGSALFLPLDQQIAVASR